MEGDKVIQAVADALKDIDRQYDAISIRVGGDEFIMTVSHNTVADIDFKEAIASSVSAVVKDRDFSETITVSIGQTCCDNPTIPLRHYIQVADQTMYIEKHLLP